MQRQHIHARPKPQPARPLRHRRQKHILRRRQAMHRRRMVFRQMIGIEPRRLQPFQLQQPQVIDFLQSHPLAGFNVVKNAELQGHQSLLLPGNGGGLVYFTT